LPAAGEPLFVAAITAAVPPATITTAIAAESTIFLVDQGFRGRSATGTGAPHVPCGGGGVC
jgi:hypothetical protein